MLRSKLNSVFKNYSRSIGSYSQICFIEPRWSFAFSGQIHFFDSLYRENLFNKDDQSLSSPYVSFCIVDSGLSGQLS